MSDLIAVAFKGEHIADQVLNKLQALQKEYLIDLEDSCVVVRDQGGQVHLEQAVNLTRTGATTGGLQGAMWGTLIGLLFLDPLSAGDRRGHRGRVGPGRRDPIGIDDKFIQSVGSTIEPGSSALFILVRSVTADRSYPSCSRLRGRGCGRRCRTSKRRAYSRRSRA